jgi:hypothetical protein
LLVFETLQLEFVSIARFFSERFQIAPLLSECNYLALGPVDKPALRIKIFQKNNPGTNPQTQLLLGPARLLEDSDKVVSAFITRFEFVTFAR